MNQLPIATIIVSFVAVLFSLSVHEAAHATVAYWLKDDTGKRLGRMTLNPVAHISLFGTILLPLMLTIMRLPAFGWAKPVPVNPANLDRRFRQRVAFAMVSAAGPLSNILLFMLFTFALCFYIRLAFPMGMEQRWWALQQAFGMPLEQLMGQKLLSLNQILALTLMAQLILINLALAIFNLLPFGPLDGASVVRGVLPQKMVSQFDRIQPVASVVVLVLFMLGGLGHILGPLQGWAVDYFVLPVARLILGV